MKFFDHQKGFSLIEVLTTMVLGMIILSLTTELIFQCKKNQIEQHELAMMQDQGRFAAHVMRKEIESAGFMGCETKKYLSSNQNAIKVYSSESIPKNLNIKTVQNSNVILIRKMSTFTNTLVFPIENSEQLYVELKPKFKKNRNIAISDCHHFEIAHLNYVGQSSKNGYQVIKLSKPLQNSFDQYSDIGKYKQLIFFVGQTFRKDKNSKSVNALYLKEIGQQKIELIDHVVSMKIKSFYLNKHHLLIYDAINNNPYFNLVGLEVSLLFSNNRNYSFYIFLKEKMI